MGPQVGSGSHHDQQSLFNHSNDFTQAAGNPALKTFASGFSGTCKSF